MTEASRGTHFDDDILVDVGAQVVRSAARQNRVSRERLSCWRTMLVSRTSVADFGLASGNKASGRRKKT